MRTNYRNSDVIADGQFAYHPRRPGDPLYAVPVDAHPEVRKVKRYAAQAGRAFGRNDSAQVERAKANLRKLFAGMKLEPLGLWARVLMIDGRWCGATGTGAYWAVASRYCNEVASEELRKRPKFEVA